ncbi:hypothetical protein V565_278380, partial [Rhizoctonia solani 123E]
MEMSHSDVGHDTKSPEEKEPESKPEKFILSRQERASQKMYLRRKASPKPSTDEAKAEPNPSENEPQHNEKDQTIEVEVDDAATTKLHSKAKQSVPLPEFIPDDSSKVVTEPAQGQKCAASQAEEEDRDEENPSILGYQPLG